jgi:predicted acylesterase/phospholipase RssA
VRVCACPPTSFIIKPFFFLFSCFSSSSLLLPAKHYDEWADYARQLDTAEGRDTWKDDDESLHYDYVWIRDTLQDIRDCRVSGDAARMAALLSPIFARPRFDDPQLYSSSHIGSKRLIDTFMHEVLSLTQQLRDTSLPVQAKLDFFRKAKEAYGQTALCLSGGASLAYFHFGVVKALIESQCMPTIISGASGGAMVAAFVGVRNDQEILADVTPDLCDCVFPGFLDTWPQRIKRFLTQGVVFDWRLLVPNTRVLCKGDTTFEEAFRRTGRIINITVTPEHKHAEGVLLNHLTAPNVVIWSAVVASAALPCLLDAVTLQAKDVHGRVSPFYGLGRCWADGSIKTDLPMAQLAQAWNVNYFLVSQVNPHIVPFVFHQRGSSGLPSSQRFGSKFRGGFITSALEAGLRLDMRKWIQIMADLDILPELFGQDWRNSLLQASSGNVTIYPSPRLRDYMKLIIHPSREDMHLYIRGGELSAYPRINMHANHFLFEQAIADTLQHLEAMSAASVIAAGAQVATSSSPSASVSTNTGSTPAATTTTASHAPAAAIVKPVKQRKSSAEGGGRA